MMHAGTSTWMALAIVIGIVIGVVLTVVIGEIQRRRKNRVAATATPETPAPPAAAPPQAQQPQPRPQPPPPLPRPPRPRPVPPPEPPLPTATVSPALLELLGPPEFGHVADDPFVWVVILAEDGLPIANYRRLLRTSLKDSTLPWPWPDGTVKITLLDPDWSTPDVWVYRVPAESAA